jgi:hypothetical protein
MLNFRRLLLIVLIWPACLNSAMADQEASNVPHVAAGPYGRCYAKSVPDHLYDPDGEPRQQGRTIVYRVETSEDVLVQVYPWFSQQIFVNCTLAQKIVVVRLGPWHRGHDPRSDHLAIAFYKGGKLLKHYSTLDIAGGEKALNGGFSAYRNVSASVSHYSVFASAPEMVKITTARGPVFKYNWMIRAETVDGRLLTFDMSTGELQ